jgi:DnaJ-class molecular chaperone
MPNDADKKPEWVRCEFCGGSGKVTAETAIAKRKIQVACPECGGSGKVLKQ